MPSSVSKTKSSSKLISIQYVRALASVVVIGWHTGWSYTVLGQVGVDLFFVVSGFVIMLVSGREYSPCRFAIARIVRIAPLYLLVTVIVYIQDGSEFKGLLASLLFWPSGSFPLVVQGWSLNLEMMYYLLFSITLFFSFCLRLVLLTIGMVIACFVFPLTMPASKVALTWANPLAFEFVAGAYLYRVWQSNRLPIGISAWLIGIAGTVLLALTHLVGGAPEGWERVGLWGIPSVAIVSAGLGIERAGQLPNIKLLKILGESSYSTYLTHILALRLVAEQLHILWAPIALTVATLWACLCGWLVYKIVELPTQKLGKRIFLK